MRLRFSLQILTLVVHLFSISAQASPGAAGPKPLLSQKKSGQDRTSPTKTSEQNEPRPYELESLSMEPLKGPLPSEFQVKTTATREVRKHSRSVTTGFWSGPVLDEDVKSSVGVSIALQNENRNETAQSYGFSLLIEQLYGLHWDYKIHCCLGDYYEPTFGFGVGSLWNTRDSLAALADIEKYHLRGHVGFEDLFNLNRRLRSEFWVMGSPRGLGFSLLVGWTWDQTEFIF